MTFVSTSCSLLHSRQRLPLAPTQQLHQPNTAHVQSRLVVCASNSGRAQPTSPRWTPTHQLPYQNTAAAATPADSSTDPQPTLNPGQEGNIAPISPYLRRRLQASAGTKQLADTASRAVAQAYPSPAAAPPQQQEETTLALGVELLPSLHAPVPVEHCQRSGLQRLVLQRQGWQRWEWRGHHINYLAAGTSGPPLLLVHGFGGSVFHWRYNIPELSKNFRVYAMDCLGMGWSSKPLVEYMTRGGDASGKPAGNVWAEQIADFVKEVIGEPAVLAGNSLGGYSVLQAAATVRGIASGLVLLNSVTAFESPKEKLARQAAAAAAAAAASGAEAAPSAGADSRTAGSPVRRWLASLGSAVGAVGTKVLCTAARAAARMYFAAFRHPDRLRGIMRQVYVNQGSIDEALIESIVLPTQHPNAAEVCCAILSVAFAAQKLDPILERLHLLHTGDDDSSGGSAASGVGSGVPPMLLVWGDKDPWMHADGAERLAQLYQGPVELVRLPGAGHSPQDDAPEDVNKAIVAWSQQLVQP